MAPFGIDIPSVADFTKALNSQAASSTGEATATKSGGITASGWRTRLKPASFRGVPFHVEQDETEGGRRAATHEFPGRDTPYTEDLGRKASTVTVEGYVIGADYMAARDALMTACNAEGPGALITPWMPERKMVCTAMRKRESAKEGGLCRFSLTFVEAGEESAPSGAALPGVQAETRADDLMTVLGGVLDGKVRLSGLPLPVAADTLAAMRSFAAQVSASAALLRFGADIPGALAALADLTPAALTGLAPSWLMAPFFQLSGAWSAVSRLFAGSSSGSLSGSLSGSTAGAGQLSSRVSALLALAASAPTAGTAPSAGTVRTAQAENRAALAQYQRAAAVAEAARTAALVRPASRQDAAALRVQVIDAIDAAMETTPDPTAYAALADLRTSTVRALAESAGAAPEVTTVRSRSVQPSLALAQRYVVSPGYGADATTAEAEILARNPVRHPGFVPPGALEVLRAV